MALDARSGQAGLRGPGSGTRFGVRADLKVRLCSGGIRTLTARRGGPSVPPRGSNPEPRARVPNQKSNCTLNFANRGVSTEFGRSHVFTDWLGTNAAL